MISLALHHELLDEVVQVESLILLEGALKLFRLNIMLLDTFADQVEHHLLVHALLGLFKLERLALDLKLLYLLLSNHH